MATTSEVEVGMAAIAQRLTDNRAVMLKAKQNAAAVSAALSAITTDYAAVISTIQAYGTSDAYEAQMKAKLAKMTTEFTALKGTADAIAAANI
ncbi:hypothetical protein EN866_33945 [Mesorhizobium sp. M2D.F.Ca.ET.223.01.1.1]|uniref:hypothetical protein n=1 Tax=Mesorhizobium sp. M2D.F.Ca.ET.223.01.1.1 TaxID=2563940 RepID=UPI0010932A8B|nr:hypothetical protein [Mesorhizobium sp. M2D.F.Ca.ET.223.01.1.1]TGR83586.1 hypothetical protein EN866_33945 [Mesorhizobium sp. M2D.F.Ca.ET.223.01.1.1]TGT75181.1 hypothetical protein EN802_09255 [bacterium M00.F.Ca.ET.159.01.1.1]TGT88048.1 hypothetical protein EN800_06145 [bacterium M00.F.Ca.ET.157.01.1.1]